MTLFQFLTLIQTIVIIVGAITCYLAPSGNFVKEKKFILPYCICNVMAMSILLPDEFLSLPARLIYAAMYCFACVEIIFIPNYIASIIGQKKGYLIQTITCASAFLLSNIVVKNPTSLFFLICNLYITYYVCKYFIWLFKGTEKLELKKSSHYWIIMGICFCYTGSIPYFIAELFILRFGGDELYDDLVQIIFSTYIILNISMYILFIKTFSCRKISQ